MTDVPFCGYTWHNQLTPAMRSLVIDLAAAGYALSAHWDERWRESWYPPDRLEVSVPDAHPSRGYVIHLTATGGFRSVDRSGGVEMARSIRTFRRCLVAIPS